MYRKTTVGFHHIEREALQRAFVSIHVSIPNLERLPANDNDVRLAKALSSIAKGNTATFEVLARAEEMLTRLACDCHVQSDRAYWERELAPETRESPAAIANTTGKMEIGLIAPDTDVCGILAESRTAQAREADAALELVQRALRLIPAAEQNIDPDDDDAALAVEAS